MRSSWGFALPLVRITSIARSLEKPVSSNRGTLRCGLSRIADGMLTSRARTPRRTTSHCTCATAPPCSFSLLTSSYVRRRAASDASVCPACFFLALMPMSEPVPGIGGLRAPGIEHHNKAQQCSFQNVLLYIACTVYLKMPASMSDLLRQLMLDFSAACPESAHTSVIHTHGAVRERPRNGKPAGRRRLSSVAVCRDSAQQTPWAQVKAFCSVLVALRHE